MRTLLAVLVAVAVAVAFSGFFVVFVSVPFIVLAAFALGMWVADRARRGMSDG
jgi:hypothetical protein